MRRIAALYDIHGNAPALGAVLREVAEADVDAIVLGGDLVSGPMPRETLDLIGDISIVDVRYVIGNGDREVVAAYDRAAAGETVGPRADLGDRVDAYVAARLTGADRALLAGSEATVTPTIDGLGAVCFCHGTPSSDTENITALTADDRLERIVSVVDAPTVVCGHTHRQFDRTVGRRRVVNAGSIGLPYEGHAAAYWAVIGPDVSLRRTGYDVAGAIALMRDSGCPEVDELLDGSLINPINPDEVAAHFEAVATGDQLSER